MRTITAAIATKERTSTKSDHNSNSSICALMMLVISDFVDTLFILFFVVFFFQAEDGIRDKLVTGVQTCALPISEEGEAGDGVEQSGHEGHGRVGLAVTGDQYAGGERDRERYGDRDEREEDVALEIGRAHV